MTARRHVLGRLSLVPTRAIAMVIAGWTGIRIPIPFYIPGQQSTSPSPALKNPDPLLTSMKLIITGATGLLGTELIRQSLQNNKITQVITLARKPIQIDHINSSKLKSVVIRDYGEYPDDVKAEFVGADACIWFDLLS